MNQPQALAAVEQVRAEVVRLEAALAVSLAGSGGEDRAALRTSWLLWAAIAAVLLLVLWCVRI